MIIKPHRGKYAHYDILIDDADRELVSLYKWYIVRRATKNRVRLYAETATPSGTITMHRLLCGFPDCDVDHINHNGLDNRRENLREATRQENLRNQRPQRQFKGISFERDRNKWSASITIDNVKHYIGRYNTPEEAAKAYDSKAKELFGQFALLNFPKEE